MSTDLRDLLREHADTPPTTVETFRLAQVRRRIAIVKRRRRIFTSLVAVLLLVAGLAVTNLGPTSLIQPAPLKPEPTLSLSQGDQRVVVSGVETLPTSTLVLTYTPATLDLAVWYWCWPELHVEIAINDQQISDSQCDRDKITVTALNRLRLAELGVAVGRTARFAMVVTGTDTPSGLQKATSGRFALAVGDAVRLEDYPLPPVLLPITFNHGGREAYRIESDPTDPLAPRTIEIDGTADFDIRAVTTTPGTLSVTIDGVQMMRHESWDFDATVTGTTVTGQHGRARATLTVTPADVSGPWAVALFAP